MGVLIRNGVRYTGGGSGVVELADLEDVSISTPSNGQALKYNSTTQEWENGDVSAVSSFADLTDTTITNPTNSQVPVYNSTTSKWENKSASRTLTYAEYQALEQAGTIDPNVDYFVTDLGVTGVPLDDSSVSANKVWSSQKINNLNKTFTFAVDLLNWSEDTTSQSGTTLYKKSISLTHVYADSPSVDIGAGTGYVLPTSAEQTAYDLIQYVTVDDTIPCLYLYASDIPTDAFYIKVTGVD